MPAERRGEFAWIRAVTGALPRRSGDGVILGPGDDAAVLRPAAGCDLVVTTDTFVEGRHFRATDAPATTGRRLAAANLSDLAAMAARPRWAVIACTLPASGRRLREARAIEAACAHALAAAGARVVGGNVTAAGARAGAPATWTVTLVGDVRRGRHWTRAGARPGDVLAVTGSPGRAAAWHGLGRARRGGARALAALERAYRAPRPRVEAALAMARAGGVRAAIDLSDGLPGDLAHLCRASGVGAVVDMREWARDPVLEAVVPWLPGRRSAGPKSVARAVCALRLQPGDDYELLLAVDPARWNAVAAAAKAAGAPLTSIGRVVRKRALRLRPPGGGEAPLPGRGYDHFG